MIKPLVSILIPAYNSAEWIADTLRSAIAQTWPNKEIIVVDDGSQDRTVEIAEGFKDQGVRVVSQENMGAAAARNYAFSLSQGDYIQWLDADDLLAPDKVASQMDLPELCKSKKTLLSASWAPFLYRHCRAKFVPTALWYDLAPVDFLLRKMQFGLHMQTATWLTSRELANAAGPWNTSMYVDDDGEYFCRVILASDSIRFVESSKVYYRLTGLRRLSYIGQSDKKMDAMWRSMQMHIGYLRSLEDSERVRTASLDYLQTWLIYFYPERPDLVKQMDDMAVQLGGKLQIPKLRWKYSWIRRLLGWPVAKRAQFLLPSIKWSVARTYDKALSRVAKS